jgi:hypothetical protein
MQRKSYMLRVTYKKYFFFLLFHYDYWFPLFDTIVGWFSSEVYLGKSRGS